MGEKIAASYLLEKGYEIKERNFSTRFGEIDLIVTINETYVFVEVKTKIGHDFGEPEEMINKNKLGRVKRMAEQYLGDNRLNVLARIDVVAVVLSEDMSVERISHHEAVY